MARPGLLTWRLPLQARAKLKAVHITRFPLGVADLREELKELRAMRAPT